MGHPKEQGPNRYRGQKAPFGIPEDLPEKKSPKVEFIEEGGRKDIDPKLVPAESMVVIKDQGKADKHRQAADQGKVEALEEGSVQAQVPEKISSSMQGQHPQENGNAHQGIGQTMADAHKLKLLVEPRPQGSKPGFVHSVVACECQKGQQQGSLGLVHFFGLGELHGDVPSTVLRSPFGSK